MDFIPAVEHIPTFSSPEILIYIFGAVLFISDFTTDFSVLKAVLWVPSLFLPCIAFILLPILFNLPANISLVKQLKWDCWRSCILNTLKVPLLLGGFSCVIQITNTAKNMWNHRKAPGEASYRKIIEEQYATNQYRITEITFESFLQFIFQLWTLFNFTLAEDAICIQRATGETCPEPMFTCGNVCFPPIMVCNGIPNCQDGRSCHSSQVGIVYTPHEYSINLNSRINSTADDESGCSEIDYLQSSSGVIFVSIAISALSMIWTVVGAYKISWIMYSIQRGEISTVPGKLVPILFICVLVALPLKCIAIILFMFSLNPFDGVGSSDAPIYYLLGIYLLYLSAQAALLLYVRHLCKQKPGTKQEITYGNLLRHTLSLAFIPCYNYIPQFSTFKRFHIIYYIIEYLRDICFYVCYSIFLGEIYIPRENIQDWYRFDMKSISNSLHVYIIYTAVFVFVILLYVVFRVLLLTIGLARRLDGCL